VTFFYDDDKKRSKSTAFFLDSILVCVFAAYSNIRSQQVQRSMVSLMESFADSQSHEQSRRIPAAASNHQTKRGENNARTMQVMDQAAIPLLPGTRTAPALSATPTPVRRPAPPKLSAFRMNSVHENAPWSKRRRADRQFRSGRRKVMMVPQLRGG